MSITKCVSLQQAKIIMYFLILNNNELFFAKNKERSYNMKDIPGFYSEANLSERNAAIKEQYIKHNVFHPALVDEEMTTIYLRYVFVSLTTQ